jgi:hypothetical protein
LKRAFGCVEGLNEARTLPADFLSILRKADRS